MSIIDHLGRSVPLQGTPQRIISLVPSITETLYHLGLDDEIVGRTRFCKFPEDKVKNSTIVAGTKDLKLDRIHELKPDLIIAEKEENTKEMVETLEKHFPVFVFEVQNYKDSLRIIRDAGQLVGRSKEAEEYIHHINAAFESLPTAAGKRVGYVIWKNPYMVVGKHTYIHSLLEKMGYVNPFIELDGRYPIVTEADFKAAQLDELFLASEPFPFKEKHFAEFQAIMPNTKIRIVDGEMFWSGVKMLEAAKYFQRTFA